MMAPFFSLFSFARLAEMKKGLSRFRERDIIFSALLGSAALLTLLLILDGYFFFAAARQDYALSVSVPARAPVSDREIDEAIRMLDARAARFEEVMGTGAGETSVKK